LKNIKFIMEIDITFICIYNNEKQLKDMLLSSFERLGPSFATSNIAFSLLLVDNMKNIYKSAAQAYNINVTNHLDELGKILVFLHQDIAFDHISFWIQLVNEFRNNSNQIIGAAGIRVENKVVSNLKYFDDKSYITEYQIDKKEEVLSLDECCFAITKDLFQKIRFDEKVCDHWHLYGVDLCYSAREKYGTTVSVLSEAIYHKERQGGLSVDEYYLNTLWKLTKKHRPFTNCIYTSCYTIKTNPFFAALDIVMYRGRIVARKLIKRS